MVKCLKTMQTIGSKRLLQMYLSHAQYYALKKHWGIWIRLDSGLLRINLAPYKSLVRPTQQLAENRHKWAKQCRSFYSKLKCEILHLICEYFYENETATHTLHKASYARPRQRNTHTHAHGIEREKKKSYGILTINLRNQIFPCSFQIWFDWF